MPEQAMSTMKGRIVPSGLVIKIDGVLNSEDNTDGIPIKLTIPFDMLELKYDNELPIEYKISVGGGKRNNRTKTGKKTCLREAKLNKTRILPKIKIGKVAI